MSALGNRSRCIITISNSDKFCKTEFGINCKFYYEKKSLLLTKEMFGYKKIPRAPGGAQGSAFTVFAFEIVDIAFQLRNGWLGQRGVVLHRKQLPAGVRACAQQIIGGYAEISGKAEN